MEIYILLTRIILLMTATYVHSISILPKEIPLLKTDVSKHIKFSLYTRENPEDPIRLLEDSNKNYVHFNPSHITHVIVHGWVCKISTFDKVKNAILEDHDYNVITVSWPSYNIDYTQSKADTVTVGTHIAKLLDNLVLKRGLNLTNVHIVGHSLGAHVAGVAGNKVTKGTIGRITGLDPAGPLYDGNITPLDGKLSSDDAKCVQIIHTNMGILGTSENLGHAAFYVNGGAIQKGCDITDVAGICSHMRVISLYASWMRKNNEYKAYSCSDWKTYKKKNCYKNKVVTMGADIKTTCPKGIYFLETSATEPFLPV